MAFGEKAVDEIRPMKPAPPVTIARMASASGLELYQDKG